MVRLRNSSLRLTYAAMTVAACSWVSAACTTTTERDDGLPEFDVEDPDPQADEGSPAFCNPAGKQGTDLAKCYAQNEALYKEFDEEAKKREPWFNFTPDSWVESPELDAKHVQTVDAAQEKAAAQRLEERAYLELQPAEAEALSGRGTPDAGKKPYLVRGLYYYRDSGAFTVFEKNQRILVRHDSVGQETTTEQRTAVIVYLDYVPREVFVDCGVTQ